MFDQAHKLRDLIHTAAPAARDAVPGLPMIAVTGGRAGVGTTTVAVNLAAVLADQGRRVVLIDAAQQRADMAQVAGIGATIDRTLSDVLAGNCSAAEALAPGPGGTLLLASRWAARSNPDFSRHAQQRLLAELQALRNETDLLVIDTGSGLTPWTRRFWLRAQLVLLVTTTNDLALMDAYAAIKLSAADRIETDIRLLANQCDSDAIADDGYRRLTTACQRFLQRSVLAVPPLPRHVAQRSASASQVPRVWEAPNSPFGHATLWLGRAVDDLLTPADRALATNPAGCQLHLGRLSPC